MSDKVCRRLGTLFLICSLQLASASAQDQYVVETIAGVAGTPGRTDGRAPEALFDGPTDLAVDSAGQIWVVDQGERTIRRISASGEVMTFARVAINVKVSGLGSDFSGNTYFAQTTAEGFSNIIRITAAGTLEALTSEVHGVLDIAVAPGGNVYALGATRAGESVIWQISPEGKSEIRVRGIDGVGLSVDRTEALYVSCCERQFFGPRGFIQRIPPQSDPSLFAGEGPIGACDGPGSQASFTDPTKLVTSFDGVVFVVDSGNNTIREIRPLLAEEGRVLTQVRTLAGSPGDVGSEDGAGPLARFNGPRGITMDSFGDLLVADTGNHTIRKLTLDEEATKLFLAQFGGGAGLQTEIVLSNPSELKTVSGRIRFRDGAGQPLFISAKRLPDPEEPVAPTGAEKVSGFEFSIPPLGGTVIVTDPESTLGVGSASIQADGPLGVLGRFSISGIGTAGVQASTALSGFVSPARIKPNGFRSALAFHNPEEQPLTVHLTLLSILGEPVENGVAVLGLPAGGHQARFLDELFEGLILEDFDGTLQAQAESGTVVAVALEFGTGAGQLSSVPVTSPPVRRGR